MTSSSVLARTRRLRGDATFRATGTEYCLENLRKTAHQIVCICLCHGILLTHGVRSLDAHQQLSPSQSSATAHVHTVWDTHRHILPH
jgi:hypothetical protein